MLHVLLLWITTYYRFSSPDKSIELEWIQVAEEQEPSVEIPVEKQSIQPQKPGVGISKDPDSAPVPPPSPVEFDSLLQDSLPPFDRTFFFTRTPMFNPQSMKSIPLDSTVTESLIASNAIPFWNAQKDTRKFWVREGPYDPLQRDIDKRNLGHERPLAVGEALQQGSQYLSDLLNRKEKDEPVRLDFIPSEIEFQVFYVLWEETQVTGPTIYSSLDSTIRITAGDLEALLSRLTQKGVLTRQMVSPSNEFTFPLGKIEMSGKNRRNRVFEYRCRVTSEELLTYLNAVLYELESGAKASQQNNTEIIARLKRMILRLVENNKP